MRPGPVDRRSGCSCIVLKCNAIVGLQDWASTISLQVGRHRRGASRAPATGSCPDVPAAGRRPRAGRRGDPEGLQRMTREVVGAQPPDTARRADGHRLRPRRADPRDPDRRPRRREPIALRVQAVPAYRPGGWAPPCVAVVARWPVAAGWHLGAERAESRQAALTQAHPPALAWLTFMGSTNDDVSGQPHIVLDLNVMNLGATELRVASVVSRTSKGAASAALRPNAHRGRRARRDRAPDRRRRRAVHHGVRRRLAADRPAARRTEPGRRPRPRSTRSTTARSVCRTPRCSAALCRVRRPVARPMAAWTASMCSRPPTPKAPCSS